MPREGAINFLHFSSKVTPSCSVSAKGLQVRHSGLDMTTRNPEMALNILNPCFRKNDGFRTVVKVSQKHHTIVNGLRK